MKKIICIIMVICALSMVVVATDENSHVYEYPELNLIIEFAEDSSLDDFVRQMIADSIAYNTPLAQTYSWCWLLGHDFYVETVSATYHKKYVDDPRCLLELYDVKKCTNCDYANPTFVTSRHISCCPPEVSAVSIDDSHTH